MTNKIISNLTKGILAGFFIGIGGFVYCSVASYSKVVGSFLFSLGLLSVCYFNLNLYTGKIGFALDNKPSFLLDLFIMFIGNSIGAALVGLIGHFTRMKDAIDFSLTISNDKISDDLYSIFLLSFMCGVMMYLACKLFKTFTNDFAKCLFVILPIMVFILCGFEHVIANIFYYTLSFSWSPKAVLSILIMFLGNSAGSLALSGSLKFIDKINQKI